MRGRSIWRPDWLSIAAPGLTSIAARWRSRRSGIHRAPVGDFGGAGRGCHRAGRAGRGAVRGNAFALAPETRPLLARPTLDWRVRFPLVARRRLGARRRHGQLEADAVGIE